MEHFGAMNVGCSTTLDLSRGSNRQMLSCLNIHIVAIL